MRPVHTQLEAAVAELAGVQSGPLTLEQAFAHLVAPAAALVRL